jgi:hypothetical protein
VEEAKNIIDRNTDAVTFEDEVDKKASLLQMFLTPNLQINAFLCVSIW